MGKHLCNLLAHSSNIFTDCGLIPVSKLASAVGIPFQTRPARGAHHGHLVVVVIVDCGKLDRRVHQDLLLVIVSSRALRGLSRLVGLRLRYIGILGPVRLVAARPGDVGRRLDRCL